DGDQPALVAHDLQQAEGRAAGTRTSPRSGHGREFERVAMANAGLLPPPNDELGTVRQQGFKRDAYTLQLSFGDSLFQPFQRHHLGFPELGDRSPPQAGQMCRTADLPADVVSEGTNV